MSNENGEFIPFSTPKTVLFFAYKMTVSGFFFQVDPKACNPKGAGGGGGGERRSFGGGGGGGGKGGVSPYSAGFFHLISKT